MMVLGLGLTCLGYQKVKQSGVVYTGAGQTGTSYLAAPNEGTVFLGLNASAKGTLTLGDVTRLTFYAPTNSWP